MDAWFKLSSRTPPPSIGQCAWTRGHVPWSSLKTGGTTNLGLAGLQWIEEAELDRATGTLSAADPGRINQGLSFEVTGLPDPQLGKILKADNSALQIGGLDIADLQGLKFQGNADAHGESFFNYQITNGANATSTEEFLIEDACRQRQPTGR